ncbi:hypothetical protein BDV59DRAFT_204766 [Aspergillus ambiguus]|uniref:uncharacterized protein n=1 Tax=Aspergillus ambiguus TaxID=176160 RepID=UPI003CCCF394
MASLNGYILTFIYATTKISNESFDYLEVPLQVISEVAASQILSGSTLTLTLDTSIMMVNETNKPLYGRKLHIDSKEDLGALKTAVHETSRFWREAPRGAVSIARKSSLTLIPLDLEEEVVNKSASNSTELNEKPGYENSSHEQYAKNVFPAIDITHEDPDRRNGSQDGSEKVSTSAQKHEAQYAGVPGTSEMQPPSHDHQEESQFLATQAETLVTERLAQHHEAEDTLKVQTSIIPDGDVPPPTDAAQSKDICQISNNQNKPQKVPYQLRSLSCKPNPLRQLPNTQESMMFPKRKPGQKIYRSHSKAAVDLRPRDENHDEVSEKDTITSISSPYPGDSSVFDKIVSTGKRKRESATKGSSSKKRKKAEPKCPKKHVKAEIAIKQPRTSLQGVAERRAIEAEYTQDPKKIQTDNLAAPLLKTKGPLSKHDQEHGVSRDPDVENGASPAKATDPPVAFRMPKDGTAGVFSQDNSVVEDTIQMSLQSEMRDSELPAANVRETRGRGKEVGKKLAAAFNDVDTLESEDLIEPKGAVETRRNAPLSSPHEHVESHSTVLSENLQAQGSS